MAVSVHEARVTTHGGGDPTSALGGTVRRLQYLACSCGYCGPCRMDPEKARADAAAHVKAVENVGGVAVCL